MRSTWPAVGVGLLALLPIAGTPPRLRAAPAPSFDAHWHDGKAELDGYRLRLTRYGSPRAGRAVAIYVTEPFSRSRHVKLDHPASPGDTVDVLKLNLARDFQTGIYDYHTLVSLFSTTADFTPLKVAFTSSEWCGQVYEELNVAEGRLSQRLSSYFDGESAERTLERPAGGVIEDELFILLRGLRGPYLTPGGHRAVPFLASPFYRRMSHGEATWTTARIQRLARPEAVVVPAGRFMADVYVVRPGDGREGRFFVERSHPNRIVRWAWTTAAGGCREGMDSGELAGTARLEYWRLHGVGDERYLGRIGLGSDGKP